MRAGARVGCERDDSNLGDAALAGRQFGRAAWGHRQLDAGRARVAPTRANEAGVLADARRDCAGRVPSNHRVPPWYRRRDLGVLCSI